MILSDTYKGTMNQIAVTEEMQIRILQNVSYMSGIDNLPKRKDASNPLPSRPGRINKKRDLCKRSPAIGQWGS